jgi:hypothetical protein
LLNKPCPLPIVQVGEEDYNQDGKPELIRFTATAQSQHPVNSFKMLLQFSYTLQVSAVARTVFLDCRMCLKPVAADCAAVLQLRCGLQVLNACVSMEQPRHRSMHHVHAIFLKKSMAQVAHQVSGSHA